MYLHIGESWAFLRQSRKWWLTPIPAILALFGLLIALSGTAAAPFIYWITHAMATSFAPAALPNRGRSVPEVPSNLWA
ncbi:MAG: DUF5989 family protein [Vicinamibacterales bacterium]